jgi:predicted ATPase/DNA-binding CsgD family transcriptional regulator
MTRIPAEETGSLVEPLTAREREIVACLADGLSNQEIANTLHLAEKTVRWYNTQIYAKLGVDNRTEAAEVARRLGLATRADDVSTAISIHRYPTPATPFVGRQRELSQVVALLADPNIRLLTILAPGGMGKTRLALEVAGTQQPHFQDGVAFVALGPLQDSDGVINAIAQSLGFTFYGETPPEQQLFDFLHGRRLLLILDNCEHLPGVAPIAADILQAAPQACILATSRERLHLQGETVYVLRGLDFPLVEGISNELDYDAIVLFVHAAHRVRPNLELRVEDVRQMAEICRLTAGMPLGIELAAGWLDALRLEDIAREVQRGIDILATDLRDVPERHRSIRATFDRTWERLSAAEQQVFMRLSVFRNGFSLEAARVVTGAGPKDLRGLANRALVQISRHNRYEIHELLRQYGAEKLAESQEQEAVLARHAVFYADFMSERKNDIRNGRQLEALEVIDPDFENIRLAWQETVVRRAWDRLPSFLHSLWFYLTLRSRSKEGMELFGEAVQIVRADPPSPPNELALGRLLVRQGWFQYEAGWQNRSLVSCDEAIRILRRHDSPEDLIAALHHRQAVAMSLSRDEVDMAVSLLQEALSISRSIGDRAWESMILFWTAISCNLRGEFAAGLPSIESGLRIAEELGDRWGLLRGYELMGVCREDEGQYEQAQQWFGRSLAIAEVFGNAFEIGQGHANMARIPLRNGDYVVAAAHLRKSMRAYWDSGYQWAEPHPLAYFARMYAAQGDPERALEVLATIDRHQISYKRTDQISVALREELESTLAPERFAQAWDAGLRRDLSSLIVELLTESV